MHDKSVETYLTATVNQEIHLPARADVAEALRQIGNTGLAAHAQGLQVLALRKYLRIQNGNHVDLRKRWAWTPQEARQQAGSGTAKLLMDEAARVQEAFSRQNPGYSLAISPLRSLERQVALWNGNLSVRAAASKLMKDTLAKLSEDGFAAQATVANVRLFGRWLQNTRVQPEPTSAAPGTSDHGQLRAVDFVVVHGGKVIAGTKTARIAADWTGSGWAQKLAQATSKTKLEGPLAHPYEPWHWSIG